MRTSRLKGAYLTMLITAFVMFCGMKVMAQQSDTSDIDRIYITCDKEMNNLTKANYETATIEVVRADGTIDISDVNASVKLRGNSTMKAEKKPVKIKFSSKVSVLGMDKGKKWIKVRNGMCWQMLLTKH